MKVELIKETDRNGKIWHCIYADKKHVYSFLEEKEARSVFADYGSMNPKVEVLETKEV